MLARGSNKLNIEAYILLLLHTSSLYSGNTILLHQQGLTKGIGCARSVLTQVEIYRERKGTLDHVTRLDTLRLSETCGSALRAPPIPLLD